MFHASLPILEFSKVVFCNKQTLSICCSIDSYYFLYGFSSIPPPVRSHHLLQNPGAQQFEYQKTLQEQFMQGWHVAWFVECLCAHRMLGSIPSSA